MIKLVLLIFILVLSLTTRELFAQENIGQIKRTIDPIESLLEKTPLSSILGNTCSGCVKKEGMIIFQSRYRNSGDAFERTVFETVR